MKATSVRKVISLDKALEDFAFGNRHGPTDVVSDLCGGVKTQAFINRGEQVTDGATVVLDVHTIGTCGTVNLATLNAATTHYHGPTTGPVITTGVLVDSRSSAELAHPHDDGVFPKAPIL